MKKLFSIVIAIVALVSCKQNTAYIDYVKDPKVFCEAVHELNSVVMGNNFPPIIASRNYTYASIAAYEVMAGCYPESYQSLAGQINELPEMPKPAGNEVLPELAATLAFIKVGEAVTFPEGSMKDYKDSIVALANDKGLPAGLLEASQAYADTISAVLLTWAKNDNYAKTRGSVKYTVIDSPGRWIPTPPMYADAIEPNWRQIRPLVMDSANQFVPVRPFPFDVTNKNSDYFKQVIAVKDAVDSLTPEQKHIAEFWDDNPLKLNVSGHVMFTTKKFHPPATGWVLWVSPHKKRMLILQPPFTLMP